MGIKKRIFKRKKLILLSAFALPIAGWMAKIEYSKFKTNDVSNNSVRSSEARSSEARSSEARSNTVSSSLTSWLAKIKDYIGHEEYKNLKKLTKEHVKDIKDIFDNINRIEKVIDRIIFDFFKKRGLKFPSKDTEAMFESQLDSQLPAYKQNLKHLLKEYLELKKVTIRKVLETLTALPYLDDKDIENLIGKQIKTFLEKTFENLK